MSKKTAAELFGSDVVVLAVLLHLAERSTGRRAGYAKRELDRLIIPTV